MVFVAGIVGFAVGLGAAGLVLVVTSVFGSVRHIGEDV